MKESPHSTEYTNNFLKVSKMEEKDGSSDNHCSVEMASRVCVLISRCTLRKKGKTQDDTIERCLNKKFTIV